ncbi:putative reverse transcriptase domain-containing protein [Tanacetum coccineum]
MGANGGVRGVNEECRWESNGEHTVLLRTSLHQQSVKLLPAHGSFRRTIRNVIVMAKRIGDGLATTICGMKVEKKGNVGEPSKDKNGWNGNKKTRTGNAFATTVNPELAFKLDGIKCVNAPILALPDGPEDLVVYYDVVHHRTGCFVLMQRGLAGTLQKALGTRLDMSMAITSDRWADVRCAPFEAMYGRKCRSLIMWAVIGEGQLIGPELVQETTEKISQIKDRLSPWKDLPEELNGVHDTFHVLNLKKCLADLTLQVPLVEIRVDVELNFMEEPMEILEREFKKLKHSRIAIVKIGNQSQGYRELDNAAKSSCLLGGGTRVWVGRGGRGRRPREGNDEHVDDLNGQRNDQGMGANEGVEGVNGNVEGANGGAPDFSTIITQQLQNLLPAMFAQVGNQGNVRNQNGNVVNENVQENIGNVIVNGNQIVLTRWIKKMEFVHDMSGCSIDQKVKYTAGLFMEFCPSNEMQKFESELRNHAMVGPGHDAYTDRFHELASNGAKDYTKGCSDFCAHDHEAVRKWVKLRGYERGLWGYLARDKNGMIICRLDGNACATSKLLPEEKARFLMGTKVGDKKQEKIIVVIDFPEQTPVASFTIRLVPSKLVRSCWDNLKKLQDKGFIAIKFVSFMGACLKELKCVSVAGLELFSDYDCEICYHPGKVNVVADALSRKERVKPKRVRALNMTLLVGIKGIRILAAQKEEVPLKGEVRTLIMDKAHKSKYSVHPRADKMYYDLRDRNWWPRMKKDIAEYIPYGNGKGIAMDFVTKLPRTSSGHDTILGHASIERYVLDFEGSLDVHLPWVEFRITNSYLSRVRCAPFEAFVCRKCCSLIMWAKVGVGVDLEGVVRFGNERKFALVLLRKFEFIVESRPREPSIDVHEELNGSS